jgi:hypothetical protein
MNESIRDGLGSRQLGLTMRSRFAYTKDERRIRYPAGSRKTAPEAAIRQAVRRQCATIQVRRR